MSSKINDCDQWLAACEQKRSTVFLYSACDACLHNIHQQNL